MLQYCPYKRQMARAHAYKGPDLQRKPRPCPHALSFHWQRIAGGYNAGLNFKTARMPHRSKNTRWPHACCVQHPRRAHMHASRTHAHIVHASTHCARKHTTFYKTGLTVRRRPPLPALPDAVVALHIARACTPYKFCMPDQQCYVASKVQRTRKTRDGWTRDGCMLSSKLSQPPSAGRAATRCRGAVQTCARPAPKRQNDPAHTLWSL